MNSRTDISEIRLTFESCNPFDNVFSSSSNFIVILDVEDWEADD